MARLYTVGEIIAATGGRAEGLTGDSVCSLSIDSREIAPEGLFVAIKGDRFDGHDFVKAALDLFAHRVLLRNSVRSCRLITSN